MLYYHIIEKSKVTRTLKSISKVCLPLKMRLLLEPAAFIVYILPLTMASSLSSRIFQLPTHHIAHLLPDNRVCYLWNFGVSTTLILKRLTKYAHLINFSKRSATQSKILKAISTAATSLLLDGFDL
jgi:hypothetical protein